MTEAYPSCVKGIECVMQHFLCMPKRGLVMQLDCVWDEEKNTSSKLTEYLIWGCDRAELLQMMWRPTSVFEQGSNFPQKQNAGKCVL